eukprot:c9476_g1_i2 orf=472-816(-)
MDEFVKMLDGVKRSLQVLRSKEDTEEGRQGNTDVAECDSFPPRSKNLLQVAIFMGESHASPLLSRIDASASENVNPLQSDQRAHTNIETMTVLTKLLERYLVLLILNTSCLIKL